MSEKTQKNKIISSIIWKLLERFGVQGIQFILQIILARLLSPNHYGVLSIMIVFTSLANVFVQNGFNTALIQNKDTDDDDYSSVLWVSLAIAAVFYALIYFAAPMIATFYEMPDIVAPFRVLALMLFPGAFNSIQIAKVRRNMDFRKIFFSNIGAIVISGIVGVFIALYGGGIWALVAQNIINVVMVSIIMFFTVRWYPKLVCRKERVKVLFSFGWKILVASLIDAIYQDIRSLVVGKKYDAGTLGYYNRGRQFPQLIIGIVDGTVKTVMFPALSAKKDNRSEMKSLMRNSMVTSAYLVFPMMAGLAGIAAPLVELLLTDKWLPCVPYLQIYCFSLAFHPVHNCNLQAINATGRSDIFLKLEIIKKIIGISALIVAVFCFDSPIAIAMTGAITTLISCFVNAFPNKKLINYSYFEQMKDILPSFIVSLVMLGAVLAVGQLPIAPILLLLVQLIVGVIIYAALSAIFRLHGFTILMNVVKSFIKKGKNNGSDKRTDIEVSSKG